MMQFVRYAVEGVTDEPVAEKLVRHVGLEPLHTLTANGKSKLDPKLVGFNNAARSMAWLVLRDLDQDDAGSCIPAFHRSLLGGDTAAAAKGMCLRLAEREVEAWLLADRDAFKQHFGIQRKIPEAPDLLDDPKRMLVELCRSSNSRTVRDGMTPTAGGHRAVGPEYVAQVRFFAETEWSPGRARSHSPSLDRAIRALEGLADWIRGDESD